MVIRGIPATFLPFDPERYHCITISDDRYIDAWWEQLTCPKTYFHSMGHPSTGLDRQGISIIPPESLPDFKKIVISDKRIKEDGNLAPLADMIQQAIDNNKHMIHFGV